MQSRDGQMVTADDRESRVSRELKQRLRDAERHYEDNVTRRSVITSSVTGLTAHEARLLGLKRDD